MNIFHKRPLCLILCVMLGGFVLFSTGEYGTRRAVILSALLIFFVSSLAGSIYKRAFLFSKLLAFFLLLSLLCSNLYFDKYFDIANKYNGYVSVEGEISEIDSSSSNTTAVTLDVDEINGKRERHRIIVRLSKKEAAYVYVGAHISLNAKLQEFEGSDGFDSRTFYFADGISAIVYEYSSLKILQEEGTSLRQRLSILKENISRQSMLSLGKDAGSLFAAVFMGERSYLSERLSLDFRRIGISHILALSGMHLAILSLGLSKFLSLIKVGKKPRTFILGIFIIFYMALTGFSVSVMRAGLMLVISYVLYLFASSRDTPTNLVTSVFIICLITPYAVFDISLWLSAFATLGIISMSELMSQRKKTSNSAEEKKSIIKNVLVKFGASLFASFFAISATMALSASISDQISLLGAFSTFIFSLLIELFIYLGIIMLGVGMVVPIGAAVMMPIYTLIDKLTYKLSSLRFTVLSTDERLMKISILVFTILFFAFIITKIKYKRTACIFLVFSFVFVHFAATAVTHKDIAEDSVVYYASERHDIIIMKSDGKTALIDIASYNENNAYDTVDILNSENIFTIDFYVASHYSFGLDDSLKTALSRVKIHSLFIPNPKCEDEEAIYELIQILADEFNVKLVTYSENEDIYLGSIVFSEKYRVTYGDDTMKNAFMISTPSKNIAYLGSGMLHYLTRDLSKELILNADTVIFGSHGKTYTPSYKISEFYPNVTTFIFAGEKIGFTDAIKAEYKKKGTEVLTDLGTVKIAN